MLAKHSQGAVLVGLHDFAFARALVVYAAEVQHAVYYNTVKLSEIIRADTLGVGAYRIKRYEHIAADQASARIVEGDYIRIIIVVEELTVDFYDFVIVAEDVCQFADNSSVVMRYIDEPVAADRRVNLRHFDALGKPLDRVEHSELKLSYKGSQFVVM